MRNFVLISNHGRTDANWGDLMHAGRMDIICHSVIASLFISNAVRTDVKLDIFLNGPPDPVKHIEMVEDEESTISKKDIGNLLKHVLRKYRPGKQIKAFPGVTIEKKSFRHYIKEKVDSGEEVYYLDKKGENIKDITLGDNPIFVIGDHEGIPKDELKYLKNNAKAISLGKNAYFSSQVINFLNIWVDGVKDEKC